MRPFALVLPLALAAALAACSNAGVRNCHRAARADGVGPDGELHYPEVCTASTTPAATPAAPVAPVASDPISQALAHLRVETPDPCRQYARARCEQGDRCEDVVREVNRITTRRRPYPRCIALLRRAERVEPRVAGK